MQGLTALSCCLQKFRSSSLDRSLSSKYDDINQLILVEENANSRTVILNRPQALNALDASMMVRLNGLYQSWEADPRVNFVILKGNGRAFCAGGDVVKAYQLINDGKEEKCKEYFRRLYSFLYLLVTYTKPHVAILDGFTMGGGGGISVHGTYRIATDKTIFAMPEVHIGFHPDVGSSYYLSRLPGHLGEYLGLTGDRLSGEEMFACGLATHYSTVAKLPWMEEQLLKSRLDSFSAMETFLAKHTAQVHINDQSSILQSHRLKILNRCFGQETVEEIVNALENEAATSNDKWCTSTLKKLREAPPLSLKITLRSIREGRFQTLSQCLAREYRMTTRAISGQISGDFCEGVRTRPVEKSFAPKWDPPCLEQVSEDMVDAYFERISVDEQDLELSSQLRQAMSA